jgi:hypothetical protein
MMARFISASEKMLNLTTIRTSGFARSVAACLVVFFAAWILLPHCHCLISGDTGGIALEQKDWSSETGVAFEAADVLGAECHCHDHAPTCLDSSPCLVEVPGSPSLDFVPMCSGDEIFGSVLPVVTKSRGPPRGDEAVAENCLAAYIRHCAFLI